MTREQFIFHHKNFTDVLFCDCKTSISGGDQEGAGDCWEEEGLGRHEEEEPTGAGQSKEYNIDLG